MNLIDEVQEYLRARDLPEPDVDYRVCFVEDTDIIHKYVLTTSYEANTESVHLQIDLIEVLNVDRKLVKQRVLVYDTINDVVLVDVEQRPEHGLEAVVHRTQGRTSIRRSRRTKQKNPSLYVVRALNALARPEPTSHHNL